MGLKDQGSEGGTAGDSQQPRLLECSAVQVGLLVSQSLFKHMVTSGAREKCAAKLLYVVEMLSWEVVSWILSGSARSELGSSQPSITEDIPLY